MGSPVKHPESWKTIFRQIDVMRWNGQVREPHERVDAAEENQENLNATESDGRSWAGCTENCILGVQALFFACVAVFFAVIVFICCSCKKHFGSRTQSDASDEETERRRNTIAELIASRNHGCSICREDNVEFPIYLDCAHNFCCDCILRHWNEGGVENACVCPMCRETIHKITEINWTATGERKESINSYYRKFNPNRTYFMYLMETRPYKAVSRCFQTIFGCFRCRREARDE